MRLRNSASSAAYICSITAALVSCAGERNPNPAPGVPARLAERRAETLSDVRYDLHFSVPDSLGEPIRGREVLRFVLRGGRGPLIIDFAQPRENVLSVRVDGEPVAFEVLNQHISAPGDILAPGVHTVEIEFVAGDLSLNRNREYQYTLFVPDRARFAFPCFDQPDIKAQFRLNLEIPSRWRAVANAPLEAHEIRGDRATYRFAETKPIPTYLFAFAAGKLELESAERAGRTLHMYHRETDTAKVARNREKVFDLHATALEWLEEYTGIPYAFEKFDFVAVPAFQYGGMEHPGAILYRASGILLDESATQNDRLRQASVIAHETAHMWFGDLVTMEWFNDVWMKEVFANFMAAKIVHPSFPELNHELRFLLTHYPSAYEVDRTAGANPIRQELENLNEAGTLYGAIIYQKAPIVMKHLETLMGTEALRDGLREYLRTHAFGNASWSDLIEILDRRTPEDLKAWSRVWVEESGRPHITTHLSLDDTGRIASLRVAQSDPQGRRRVWNQRLNVLLAYPETMRVVPVQLDDRALEVAEAAGLAAPNFILANGRGLGYGLFELDPRSREYLLQNLPEVKDPLVRGVAWITLWDAMLEGWVEPKALADLAFRTLSAETDELNIERVLSDLAETTWRYLPPDARDRLAPQLEQQVWTLLERAATTSRKAAYFRTYRSVALTANALERLERVWRKELETPGLPLSELDYTALALALAAREVTGWEMILAEQAQRITNPDRREQFAFVRPAVSADPAARDSFFESLRNPKNREHEPWVLEGLALLHHPLRAPNSVKHIRPSLEMLEEIQRTGDIFFPKGWLDATFGGHNSAEVAEIVCGFLRDRPDYPPPLRGKILQSADPLFRAAAIVHAHPTGYHRTLSPTRPECR